jgi:uncharacterized protein YkwD
MRRSHHFTSSAILLIAFVTCLPARADEDGLDDPPPLTPAQSKAALDKGIAEFRNPKTEPARRKQVARDLVNLGPDGARAVVPELAKEVAARRKDYFARFDKAAADVMAKRLNKPDAKKEVQALRNKILGVSRDRNLTPDKITDFADPARRRLEELMSLTRDEVLKSDKALETARAGLIATVKPWREGADKLPADARKGDAMTPPTPEAFDAALQEAEVLAATLAALPDRKDRAIITANLEPAKQVDPAEARGVYVLNLLRARVGIGALALDVKLCAASRDHSKDMQEFNFFDHVSPVPGKEEPWDRAKLHGTTASSENIYQGGERGEDAIEGWWHSPGHHANMMAAGPRRVGMGKHEGFWTQLFGM